MRVAYIGNIFSECGIATYNEALFGALKQTVEIKFFAEKNGRENTQDIVYCWERTEFPKYNLIDQINLFKPDVVFFSHEYGIYPKSYFFASLVSYFRLKGYKVVTLFHSVYEFHKDKLTTESICKNVVVHSSEAKECLIRKGISPENLHIVPHGCSFQENKSILPPLWNHFGNQHVILQSGFLFEYKNHLGMLSIVSELKKKYPDILYIILASQNPKCQSEHDKLYGRLVIKIEELNLVHNVIVDRGFVSHDVLMSYIRTSAVFVLPYNPKPELDVYAASGMSRIVLKTATPLIVSYAHLFDGLDNVVIRAKTNEEWIQAISNIFDNKIDKKEMIEKRAKFIEENSWDNAADKLIKIFE